MSKTSEPTTKDEAAQILSSAVNYCIKAGIAVQGYDEHGTLFLSFAGLLLVQDESGASFVPVKDGAK
jgi:hypothetical protein